MSITAKLSEKRGLQARMGGHLAIPALFTSGEGVDSIVRIVSDAAEKPEAQPTATGESAISLGRYCHVPGKNAMAVNYDNLVEGTYGFAANHRNIIGANASAAATFGARNEIYAPYGFTAGRLNKVLEGATEGLVAGLQNVLKVPYGARFGQWCDEQSDALFAIGNGDRPSNRKDAFAVFMDGSMALNGEKFTSTELRSTINAIGDIKTALDEIIAIQEALIGGASA